MSLYVLLIFIFRWFQDKRFSSVFLNFLHPSEWKYWGSGSHVWCFAWNNSHKNIFFFNLFWISKQISIHFSLKVRNIKKEINALTTKRIHGGISLSLVNVSASVSCDFCFLIPVRQSIFHPQSSRQCTHLKVKYRMWFLWDLEYFSAFCDHVVSVNYPMQNAIKQKLMPSLSQYSLTIMRLYCKYCF